jgi:hypothetical protein
MNRYLPRAVRQLARCYLVKRRPGNIACPSSLGAPQASACLVWVNLYRSILPAQRRLFLQLRKYRCVAANVETGHNQTHALQQTVPLFDHIVGAGEEGFGDGQPERLGGF